MKIVRKARVVGAHVARMKPEPQPAHAYLEVLFEGETEVVEIPLTREESRQALSGRVNVNMTVTFES